MRRDESEIERERKGSREEGYVSMSYNYEMHVVYVLHVMHAMHAYVIECMHPWLAS